MKANQPQFVEKFIVNAKDKGTSIIIHVAIIGGWQHYLNCTPILLHAITC